MREEVDFTQLRALLNGALEELYAKDSVLFDYETEEKTVAERCICFRLGLYLHAHMEQCPGLAGADLDFEYNRNFAHPKGMFHQTEAGIRQKIKDAIPDFIIHQRGSNGENLLVMEIKKGKPSKTDRKNDEEKLGYFTDPGQEYQYRYGFYVELYNTKKAKVVVYSRGKVQGDLCYTWPQGSD